MKRSGDGSGRPYHGLLLTISQVLFKFPNVVITQVGDGEQEQRQHHKLKTNRKAKSHGFSRLPLMFIVGLLRP